MFFNKKLKMKKEELENENIQLRQIIDNLNQRIKLTSGSYRSSINDRLKNAGSGRQIVDK